MLPASAADASCVGHESKRGRRSRHVSERSGHSGSVALCFSERTRAALAVRRQRFERAERHRRCDDRRLIRRRRRERQAGHRVVGLIAGCSLRGIGRSAVARSTACGTASTAAVAAATAAGPRPPAAAAGQARHHRGQSQHCCETFHDGGIPFRGESKSGRHSLIRQRIGSKKGRGNVRRGDGTLTIRRENSTEVRQAGRDIRTHRQTGQDVILLDHFEPYIS